MKLATGTEDSANNIFLKTGALFDTVFPPRIEESLFLAYRNRNLKQLQIYFTSSQLYAKLKIFKSIWFPLKQTKQAQVRGVSFHFNDTVVKIGREFNTRRNTRFKGRGYKMEQNNDVGLNSPPTNKRHEGISINENY